MKSNVCATIVLLALSCCSKAGDRQPLGDGGAHARLNITVSDGATNVVVGEIRIQAWIAYSDDYDKQLKVVTDSVVLSDSLGNAVPFEATWTQVGDAKYEMELDPVEALSEGWYELALVEVSGYELAGVNAQGDPITKRVRFRVGAWPMLSGLVACEKGEVGVVVMLRFSEPIIVNGDAVQVSAATDDGKEKSCQYVGLGPYGDEIVFLCGTSAARTYRVSANGSLIKSAANNDIDASDKVGGDGYTVTADSMQPYDSGCTYGAVADLESFFK